MRLRTAKQRAERIDMYYFRRAHGLRRWRILLSIALPIAAVVWVAGLAMAGSRAPYSAGSVAAAHAFTELKCEVCHRPAAAPASRSFRTHASEAACLACHDAPAHAANQTTPPACAACHREHRGRIRLADTDDRFCTGCHGALQTAAGPPTVATRVGTFPAAHPEFAAAKRGAVDPGRVRFSHAVHLEPALRGPSGPETLTCADCHAPEVAPADARPRRVPVTSGLMAPLEYRRQCARCHTLFFDERIEQPAPHDTPERVRAFVQQALADYIQRNPDDLSKPDSLFRRVPLNFPRPVEPPARSPQEWVARRSAADQRLLWSKTCAECHAPDTTARAPASNLPVYAKSNLTRNWMPRAAFSHGAHAMLGCAGCHAATRSTRAADVLMPPASVCASCHAPGRGALDPPSGRAESRCFECHRYHDWSQWRPVTPVYAPGEFR